MSLHIVNIFITLLTVCVTEAMRFGAEKQYGAFRKEDGWHGYEEVNHLTPSGSERWLMTYNDKRAWENEEIAIKKIKEILKVK